MDTPNVHTKMTYPDGGENAGDTMQTNVDPAMPGPRVMTPVQALSAGSDLSMGFGERIEIHSVTPNDIGADTIGGGNVHMQHPKNPCGRGTRFG